MDFECKDQTKGYTEPYPLLSPVIKVENHWISTRDFFEVTVFTYSPYRQTATLPIFKILTVFFQNTEGLRDSTQDKRILRPIVSGFPRVPYCQRQC